jgi:hypothetical protein
LKYKLTGLFGHYLASIVIDLIDLGAYIAMVAYWRFFWDVYDFVVYQEVFADYIYFIFVATHFVTYLIYVLMSLIETLCCETTVEEEIDQTTVLV